jgi:predicted site-specific integrase-resolvase
MQRGNESTFYKLCDACRILGVKPGVLRKWADTEQIKAMRTPGGMRLFDISSIDPGTNIYKVKKKENPICILYSRVSSSKQKDDLERQKLFIRDNIDEHTRSQKIQEVSDIGSGINFKRPGLLRILGLVKEGKISTIVVASKDRLARFGFELIEWLCTEFKTKIVVLNSQDPTPESELGNDLMAIVQVYCCRWNGRRRYKTKDKINEIETSPKQGTETEIE